MSRRLLLLAAALLVPNGVSCNKGLHLRVMVERGDVGEEVYRLRVNGMLNGDPRNESLFPLEAPPSALDLPNALQLDFADPRTAGTVQVVIEALDQSETTILGVGIATVTLPGRPGYYDATVTLSSTTNDLDGDSIPDALDNCLMVANPMQQDCDMDGVGDACQTPCGCCPKDMDGDGVEDSLDNCPLVSNPLQEDTVPAAGPDGIGDACGDFDADGAMDLDDCAPENLAVFPGNADPCEGADADCVPGVCAFDLAGLVVYDLAVSSAGRVGLTVDGAAGAGMGEFRTLDGMDPLTAVLTTASVADPRGVAVNIAPTHLAVAPDLFYVTDASTSALINYDAFGGVNLPNYPLAAAATASAFSPFGELSFVPLATSNSVVVFDPCETPGMSSDCYEQLGNTSNIDPVTLDLTVTTPTAPNPGLGLDASWRVRAMALRPGPLIDTNHLAYLLFDGQPAVVGLSVNPMTLEASAGASGLVPMTGTAPATALFYDATNDDLLVTSGDGAADGELRVFAANGVTSMTALLSTTSVPGPGVPSCPSGVALGTDATTLWVADACNDVVWEGTKSADGMTVTFDTAHPVCAAPSRLGVVGAPGGDVVYVGCDGALGVVGSN